MDFFRKLGIGTSMMLCLFVVIILFAEYMFLNGDQLHGIFLGLWAPTLIGVLIIIKLVDNGGK